MTSQTRGDGSAGPAVADNHVRQPRGNRRRQQILDAAVELFAAKGYRGTGLAALADRVGMTAAGLLYYFGTKERLLREVVAERDRVDAAVADDLTLSNLRDLGHRNTEMAVLTRLYIVLGVESLDRDEPLNEFFVERYELARSLVRSMLLTDIDRGTVRGDVDVDQVAAEVVGVLLGLEVQWLTDPDRVDLGQRVEAYVDGLVESLRPRAGSPRRGGG